MHTGFGDLACERYEALLEDHLNGELSGEDARRTSKHLETCERCREALDDAKASTALLRSARSSLDGARDLGPGFARTVMAQIRVEEERQAAERMSFWQPVVSLAWRVMASATVALAILVAYAVTGSRQSLAMVATVGQAEMHDLLSPDPTVLSEDRDEVLMMVAVPNYDNN